MGPLATRSVSRLATLLLSLGLAGSSLFASPSPQARAADTAPVPTWTYPSAPTTRMSTDPFSATWTESGSPTASRQSQWWKAPLVAGACGTFVADGSPIDETVPAASFYDPQGLAFDPDGNLFVADAGNRKIRMITPDGVVSTFAGSGDTGSTDATGTDASFAYPQDLAFDPAGNLYVADAYNNKIRKITPAGIVSTFAGSGVRATTDATGTDASFDVPIGLAFDANGNLFVSDGGGDTIRMITPAGIVSTFAGSGVEGSTDATGTAASFTTPAGLAFDAAGDLYVGDSSNNKIRKITPGAVVTTFAGSGAAGSTNATRNRGVVQQPPGSDL